ncbi:hypothetical protein [Fimbriiglobus ruber]|nr:hypothetical protein [Fimbriiglobus ruber]
MPEIDQQTEILEDYEPLLDLNAAFESRNRPAFDGILHGLADELANEYRAKIEEKVRRWATATRVGWFYDRAPVRAYIQVKMMYRDGFYEATIMVSRSIAEMICYDRLDGVAHPFGSIQQVERRCFRDLIRWLASNDSRITTKVFDNLNSLYDLGNKYVHPKSGQNAKDDSLKALYLIGESVFEVYGVKSHAEMLGRTLRTPYADFPDICGGTTSG